MVRPSDNRPRPGRKFQLAEHGTQPLINTNIHYFNKMDVHHMWPSWEGSVTTIRILPGINPGYDASNQNSNYWDVYRVDQDYRGFGDWIRSYECAVFWGNPPTSFITHNPLDEDYDQEMNPAWRFYWEITKAVSANSKPEWSWLTKKEGKKSAKLERPKLMHFIQCVVLQHKNKILADPAGMSPGSPSVVMTLSKSASEALLSVLNERVPAELAPTDVINHAGFFTAGDIVDINSGKFVQFYQHGTNPGAVQGQQGGGQPTRTLAERSNDRGATTSHGGNFAENNRYDAAILDTFQGDSPCLSGVESEMLSKVKDWDTVVDGNGKEFPGLIRIGSAQEQIEWMISAFPADMIVYALEPDFGDLIPDSVKKAAVNRVQSPVGYANPSAAAQHGYGQGTAQPSAPMPEMPRTGFGVAAQAPVSTGRYDGPPAGMGNVQDVSGPPTGTSSAVPSATQNAPAWSGQQNLPVQDAAAPPVGAMGTAVSPSDGFDPPPTGNETGTSGDTLGALREAKRKALANR